MYFTKHYQKIEGTVSVGVKYICNLNVKHSKYVPCMLNFFMDDLHVDAINDNHRPT